MKNMKGIVFAVFLMAILFMPLVSAVPPFNVQSGADTGSKILITYPPNGLLKQNQDYRFNFHLYNISSGGFLTNETISCYFHLYNESGKHIVTGIIPRYDFDSDDRDYYVDIKGENFSSVGDYGYLVDCNASAEPTGEGGSLEVGITVTRDGNETNIGNWNLAVIIGIVGIALIFIALSFMFTREQKGIKTLLTMLALGCMVLAAGYIILMTNTGNPIEFSNYSALNTVLLTITISIFGVFILYYLIVYTKEAFRAVRHAREGVEPED